ncbi:hypothetical protein GOV11_01210 [Candidatus Woesearchaeota archaeon]|nr:hypothetical protein [Candidatus Woesearchaeota archaeon]
MLTEPSNGMRRMGDERDIVVVGYEVEKEGIIKFKPVYEAIWTFMKEKGYSHPITGSENIEDLYWERWMPAGHKEQHIWWRFRKDINKYIGYFVQINWQTLLVSPREVAHKGKKVNAEFIDCIVRFEFILQFDRHDLFKRSLGWKMKRLFFHKIYKDELNKHKQELYDFAMELQRLLKHLFEMQSDIPAPTNFMPPMGYKEP